MRLSVILVSLLLFACSDQAPSPAVTQPELPPGADLLLTNARVYTLDAAAPWAEAVVVTDERIVYVGDAASAAEWVGGNTRVVDLRGALVMPGFQDTHIHPISGGVEALACDLNDLEGVSAYRTRIAEFASANPSLPWITGGGWSMAEFGPGGRPGKALLDELVPDRPVFLSSADGHSAWVNSVALEIAGITADTPDPIDGIIDRDPVTGELIGSLQEGAMRLVESYIPPTTQETLRAGMAFSRNMLHGYGITSIQVAYAREPDLQAMVDLDEAGELNLRIAAALWWERDQGLEQVSGLIDLRERYTQGNLRVTGVKIMQDGVMENYTAVMLEPYLIPERSRGIPMVEPELLKQVVTSLDAEGFQVHFHAIGDGAVRQALDAIETARQANGPADHRHHISHLELIHPDDVGRFAALDTVANFQPLWAYPDRYITELTVPFIGEERAQWLYPISSVLAAGGEIVFGSDWSVTTANPFPQIETAVTRRNPQTNQGDALLPKQAISLADAVAAFTLNAARVNHQEEVTGSIEVGKFADLIVLDQNLFEIAPQAISDTRVQLTLFSGQPVFGSFEQYEQKQ